MISQKYILLLYNGDLHFRPYSNLPSILPQLPHDYKHSLLHPHDQPLLVLHIQFPIRPCRQRSATAASLQIQVLFFNLTNYRARTFNWWRPCTMNGIGYSISLHSVIIHSVSLLLTDNFLTAWSNISTNNLLICEHGLCCKMK
jgi:hypothetical protein